MRSNFLRALVALALFGSLHAPSAYAGVMAYDFSVDTSSVAGTAGFVDFQFNPGAGDTQDAFIQILNFQPGSGLSGTPDTVGDVSGSLPNAVTIRNTAAWNDYFQGFTFGSTLMFRVLLDGPALIAPNGTATSQSIFGFGLYDAAINPILTADPLGFAATLDVNLDGSTTPHALSSAVTASAVPEPGTWQLAATALLGLGWFGLRRKQ